jgi:predicted transposase YdaD
MSNMQLFLATVGVVTKVVRKVVNQSLYAIAQAKQEHHNQQQFKGILTAKKLDC